MTHFLYSHLNSWKVDDPKLNFLLSMCFVVFLLVLRQQMDMAVG